MIRVIDGDPRRLSGLGPSKVVHVKVIEQKGDEAVIELNGLKMKAKMDKGLPGNFLAFIEKNGNTFQLKLLKNVQSSQNYKQLTRQKLVEKIEVFFLENNIPFSQGLLKTALRFTESGLKLDKALLNQIHRISISLGEDFAAFLINLASQGLELTPDLVHFFFQLKMMLRKLIEDKNNKSQDPLIKAPKEHPADLLIAFLANLFNTDYDARLLPHQEQHILIQVVKREEEDISRYYIDASLSEEEKLMLIIDWGADSLKANVLLSNELYDSIIKDLNKNKKELLDKVRSLVLDKKIIVDFHPLERDIHLFELDNTISRSGFASNLDIFV